MMKWLKKNTKELTHTVDLSNNTYNNITELIDNAKDSADFIHYPQKTAFHNVYISYYKAMIDGELLHRDVLPYIIHSKAFKSLKDLKDILPIESVSITKDIKEIQNKLLRGFIVVQFGEYDEECAVIRAENSSTNRAVSVSEIEFSVIGPKEAFIENLDSNLYLIRRRLPVPELRFKEIIIGKYSKTRVIIAYLEGIANIENINTVSQRIQDIESEVIPDSSFLEQMISDNTKSVFPQLVTTERPDRVVAMLNYGQVAILSEGSPQALLGPTGISEYFVSPEDYYLSWLLGSLFRFIRFLSVIFSTFATPLYVAILTFHYQMIPKDLLAPLISSRVNIPFPPILEVLFLELTIELLREAGARLPTKVGQTLGIVGGIVIGQASVEAGLTSNILLIIVSLSALASFTTPIYKMANTIRILRFPFIFFAAIWGGVGIVIAMSFIIVHLLRLESLGRPYLSPIYPPRLLDMTDTVIRLPYNRILKRPISLGTKLPSKEMVKEMRKKKDIDE
ncbi:spore germination protein [Fictibacillus nanhaiensis]|uniref:spore germination protein n=1 Tax=Fictibacillus nanhaiensis TaxID=742169 RepID=UPI001C95BD52|nr:spore germination protein [Fictibacillus nanhaiensis]MBY6036767.1 spore germination protein [Fictibacillus nanhaiensis]